ncbi:hypothetical protein LguiA_015071 [Lonicera macranthoides]
MLSREIADLPTPKQPAFTERQSNSVKEEIQENCSVNSATFTGDILIIRSISKESVIKSSVGEWWRANIVRKVVASNSHGSIELIDMEYSEYLCIDVDGGVIIVMASEMELFKAAMRGATSTPKRVPYVPHNLATVKETFVAFQILLVVLAIGGGEEDEDEDE